MASRPVIGVPPAAPGASNQARLPGALYAIRRLWVTPARQISFKGIPVEMLEGPLRFMGGTSLAAGHHFNPRQLLARWEEATLGERLLSPSGLKPYMEATNY